MLHHSLSETEYMYASLYENDYFTENMATLVNTAAMHLG